MKPGLCIVSIALLPFVAFSRSDVTVGASDALDIPTVEHCTLIANPASYDGQEIRLRGVYSVCGSGDSKFFSSSCSGGKTLWVEFDQTYQSCSKPKAVKSLEELKAKSGARWKRPHVSVVVLDYRSAVVEFVGKLMASNPYTKPEPPPAKEPFDHVRPIS